VRSGSTCKPLRICVAIPSGASAHGSGAPPPFIRLSIPPYLPYFQFSPSISIDRLVCHPLLSSGGPTPGGCLCLRVQGREAPVARASTTGHDGRRGSTSAHIDGYGGPLLLDLRLLSSAGTHVKPSASRITTLQSPLPARTLLPASPLLLALVLVLSGSGGLGRVASDGEEDGAPVASARGASPDTRWSSLCSQRWNTRAMADSGSRLSFLDLEVAAHPVGVYLPPPSLIIVCQG
jgi:hypothetical protein